MTTQLFVITKDDVNAMLEERNLNLNQDIVEEIYYQVSKMDSDRIFDQISDIIDFNLS